MEAPSMDDIERLNEQLRRTKEKGLRWLVQKEVQPSLPDLCDHQAALPTIIKNPNGRTGYLRHCPACDLMVPPWLTKRQTADALMEALPVIVYKPDPELEGQVCHVPGCDRTDTMEHHLFPVHIFGERIAEEGGLIWLCGDHHRIFHTGLRRWKEPGG